MASLFNNRPVGNPQPLSREALAGKYNAARVNLLLVLGFTAVNVVIALCGGSSYFLFSAFIPYFISLMGATLCGLMSPEYYAEIEMLESDLLPTEFIAIFAVITVAILACYLLFWFMSKKHPGWLIAALVFFVLDTLFLLMMGLGVDSLFDVIFHAMVIYYLVSGVMAHYQLKRMPPELVVTDFTDLGEAEREAEENPQTINDSAEQLPNTESTLEVAAEAEPEENEPTEEIFTANTEE